MAIESRLDAFVHELQDMLSAEKQLTKALPKMAKKASTPKLKEALRGHLRETQEHVNRLELAFESIEQKAQADTCQAMKGLVEEGEELLKEVDESALLDAALIAAAQKVEHYEMASYGTICAWGEMLGYDEAVEHLKQNFAEEKAADKKLGTLAKSINKKACVK